MFRTAVILVAILLLNAPRRVSGQEQPSLALPPNPAVWINSGPIALEALEGKAVVLYYFEESCPRCGAKWPELLQAANSFQGEPILFIAVNSGTAPQELARYVRQHRINWPIIADFDRSFEQASSVGQISLQNIYQVRIVLPDGRVTPGDPKDLAGTARHALEDAQWKIDPTDIPIEMQAAWMAVEFGNFPAGARAIKQSLRSGNPMVREAGEKLWGYVNAELEAVLGHAEELAEAGRSWQAYQAYAGASERFQGYDLPGGLSKNMKALEADEDVQAELRAMKQLEVLKRRLQSANSRALRAVVVSFRRLIESAPGTEAAAEATEILQAVGATP